MYKVLSATTSYLLTAEGVDPLPRISTNEALLLRYTGFYKLFNPDNIVEIEYEIAVTANASGHPEIRMISFDRSEATFTTLTDLTIELTPLYIQTTASYKGVPVILKFYDAIGGDNRPLEAQIGDKMLSGSEQRRLMDMKPIITSWTGRYASEDQKTIVQLTQTGDLIVRHDGRETHNPAYIDINTSRSRLVSRDSLSRAVELNEGNHLSLNFEIDPTNMKRAVSGEITQIPGMGRLYEMDIPSLEEFFTISKQILGQTKQIVSSDQVTKIPPHALDQLHSLITLSERVEAGTTTYPVYHLDRGLGTPLNPKEFSRFQLYAKYIKQLSQYELDRLTALIEKRPFTSHIVLEGDGKIDYLTEVSEVDGKFQFQNTLASITYKFETKEAADQAHYFITNQIHTRVNNRILCDLECSLSPLLTPDEMHVMNPVIIAALILGLYSLASGILMVSRIGLPEDGKARLYERPAIVGTSAMLQWLQSPIANAFYMSEHLAALIRYVTEFVRPTESVNERLLRHTAMMMGQFAINGLELPMFGRDPSYVNIGFFLHTHDDGAPYLQVATNREEAFSLGNDLHRCILISTIQTAESNDTSMQIFLAVINTSDGNRFSYMPASEALNILFDSVRSPYRLAPSGLADGVERPEGLVIYGIERDIPIPPAYAPHSEARMVFDYARRRDGHNPPRPIAITSTNRICHRQCFELLRGLGFSSPNLEDESFPSEVRDTTSDQIVNERDRSQTRMMIIASAFYALFGKTPGSRHDGDLADM